MKTKRQTTTKPSTLRRKALQLWSYIVREKAGFKCEYCGATKFLQAHHIIGKRFKPTMFWICNGIALCARCHKWGIGISAHENPIKLAEYLKENRAIDYKQLIDIDHTPSLMIEAKMPVDYQQALKDLEDSRFELLGKTKKSLCTKRGRKRNKI